MTERKRFGGFSSGTGFTPIPNPFFGAILPHADSLAELKVTLYAFWALYRKKGYPRFITGSELRGDESLMIGLQRSGSPDEELQKGLAAAVEHGVLLHLQVQSDGKSEDLYFLNDQQSRRALVRIEGGEIHLGEMVRVEPASTEEKPNIFSLYEQHIGLLTPMIAEELKEAEELYPASWIADAFKESLVLNKRSWRYIVRILERWAAEGRDHGAARTGAQEDIDPKEYLRKYGHLTRD